MGVNHASAADQTKRYKMDGPQSGGNDAFGGSPDAIGPTIYERLKTSMGRGRVPVQDLLSTEGIKGKTIIKDDYERVILSKLRFLNEAFLLVQEPPILMLSNFLKDYEEYGPAVAGIAREQFVRVHSTEPPDVLRDQERRDHTTPNRRM